MFKLPMRPTATDKPLIKRRYFWTWFLINALMNLVDIENMPPDMETNFKYSVLVFGRVLFFNDKNDELRALWFADGGKVPVYRGQIVEYLVTNPVIGDYRFSAEDENAYAVYLTMLDRCQIAAGYSDMIRVFSDDLAENDISVSMAQFLKRLPVVFKAKTDSDKEAIQAVLQAIWNGEPDIVAQTTIANMLERMDGTQNSIAPLSEFSEFQQYKLGQFYAMLGVNTVWNLKQERVAAAENSTNGETARYNIADIIDNMNQQLEEVNSIFGTDFHARLNVERAEEIAENVTKNEPGEEPENDPEEGAENADNSPD